MESYNPGHGLLWGGRGLKPEQMIDTGCDRCQVCISRKSLSQDEEVEMRNLRDMVTSHVVKRHIAERSLKGLTNPTACPIRCTHCLFSIESEIDYKISNTRRAPIRNTSRRRHSIRSGSSFS